MIAAVTRFGLQTIRGDRFVAPIESDSNESPMRSPRWGCGKQARDGLLSASPPGAALAPEADTLAPEADTLAPEADTLAPEADTLAPEADTLAPEADALASEASAQRWQETAAIGLGCRNL
ncbi:MAG: hypothetical protein QM769_12800 [Pseudoxanthomonas sp.]